MPKRASKNTPPLTRAELNTPAREIPLTHAQVALVDDADYPRVSRWNWSARKNKNGTWLVSRREAGKTILLSRFIDDTPPGFEVIHLNDNHLDYRRCNLCRCTRSERMMHGRLQNNSTSGYRGVSFNKPNGRWQAHIKLAGKQKTLGYFDSPEEASAAYEESARRLHGKFYRPPENRTPLRKAEHPVDIEAKNQVIATFRQKALERRWKREESTQKRLQQIESGELVWTPGDAFGHAISLDVLLRYGDSFGDLVIDPSQPDPLDLIIWQEEYAERKALLAGAQSSNAYP